LDTRLFMTTVIGQTVQNFYTQSPFPDFELARFNHREDLVKAARSLPKFLDQQIPVEASVIDIGTGTGQLSAFLSLKRRQVYGIDFSAGSLAKARALKTKLGLETWYLRQVDILDPDSVVSVGQKFDYVLCLGVLHHTGNPYQAFQNILTLLKPGGCLAIGLYNRFGRFPHWVRVILARTIFKNSDKVKDYFIRIQIGNTVDKERARDWWNDQYLHPHESAHSVGEVLRWFRANGIEYCQSLPPLGPCGQGAKNVWERTPSPSLWRRFYHQLHWIKETNRDGGYWMTFGRF